MASVSQSRADFGKPSRREAEEAIRILLRWIGEDPLREGLIDTPARVVKSYEELFAGYASDPSSVLARTFTEVGGYRDIVLVKDIRFFTHCEHHMVPVIGRAHIAYLPEAAVVGLSKLARVVEIYARRLQTQESMTAQISEAIASHFGPRGVAVMLEAEHLCMAMRGIRMSGSMTTTITFSGEFQDNADAQASFIQMVRDRG